MSISLPNYSAPQLPRSLSTPTICPQYLSHTSCSTICPTPTLFPTICSISASVPFSNTPLLRTSVRSRKAVKRVNYFTHTHTCAPVSLRIGNAFLLVYLPVTEDAIYTRKPCLMTSSWADIREAMPGRAIPMISEKLQCTLKAQISHRTEYNYSRLAHDGAHSVIRVRTRRRISE